MRQVRNVVGVFLFICILILAVLPLNAQKADEDECALDKFTDDFFSQTMSELGIPGVVLVVVHDGEVVFETARGYANIDRKLPMDPNETVFRVASVAKLLTAMGTMVLVEDGQLDLDGQADSYLSRVEVPIFKEPIKIRHLLTHTDGLELSVVDSKTLDPNQIQDMDVFLAEHPLQTFVSPGQMVTYGNQGSAVLGLVIEEVAGFEFGQFIDERVFKPLGMSNSSFDQPLSDRLSVKRVQEYRKANSGYEEIQPSYSHMVSAGGLHTTAVDLARLLQELTRGGVFGGASFFKEKTLDGILNTRFSPHPGLPGVTFGFLEQKQNGRTVLYRDGDSEGAKARVALLPEERVGFVLLYNSNAPKFRDAFLRQFMHAFFPEDIEYDDNTRLSSEELGQFAGTYNYVQYPRHDISKLLKLKTAIRVEVKDDSLVVYPLFEEPFGGLSGRTTFVHVGNNLFRGLERQIYIAFGPDQAGVGHYLHSGTGYHGTYDKQSWYDVPEVQFAFWGLFLMLFGCQLFVGVTSWVRRRFTHQAFPLPRHARWVEKMTVINAGLYLAFLGLLVPAMFLVGMVPGLPAFVQRISPLLILTLSLPLLSIPCLIVTGVIFFRYWKRLVGLGWRRCFYFVGFLGALLFLGFLWDWRLLAFWL